MKENTNMLSVNEVSKSYPGKENALKEVSFQVDAGEICGLVGNNGAGKSSIIRCIVGAQEADAGESHIELLQILVNNLQKVELMEKLDHANTVEEYWKLIISMDGLEDS